MLKMTLAVAIVGRLLHPSTALLYLFLSVFYMITTESICKITFCSFLRTDVIKMFVSNWKR